MSDRRVALVTGGNRGIGLEVCRQLARRGLRVILTARARAKADAAARTLRSADAGLEIVPEVLDVTDARSIAALAAALAARQELVDVLVNNAAILVGESRGLLDTPVADLRATFDTNVFGVVAVSQAFVPQM